MAEKGLDESSSRLPNSPEDAIAFSSMFNVKMLSASAVLPYKTSQHPPRYVIASDAKVKIPARDASMVQTGLSFEINEGFYAAIGPITAFPHDNLIFPINMVIDPSTRGPLVLRLVNKSCVDYEVTPGTYVAELEFRRYLNAKIVEVDSFDE